LERGISRISLCGKSLPRLKAYLWNRFRGIADFPQVAMSVAGEERSR
jgi:hypothetical protein